MSACVVLTVSLAFQQYYDLLFLSFPFAVNVTGLSKFVVHFLYMRCAVFYLEVLLSFTELVCLDTEDSRCPSSLVAGCS